MKANLHWLREWVDLGNDVPVLAHALTMAGLEIEGIQPVAPALEGVIVGHVIDVQKHPDAEKLSVCRVRAGERELQIVCGAANVRAGMKAPLATIGATLPGGIEIKAAKLRGVDSEGMLCSARELGLNDDVAGLMELPSECKDGQSLSAALALDDRIFEINLTPNRGDCMSIAGVAREIAALRGTHLRGPAIQPVAVTIADTFPVRIEASLGCAKFAGRVIRGIRPDARSPLWLRERLRRMGLRSINVIVDVTNYVMLELGQPMHAYDLSKLHGAVVVRHAQPKEKLTLLDATVIELDSDVLVIADEQSVLGMGGVMGGLDSGINDKTQNVFLEVAHFTPDGVAGRGRRYGLITDASQRFERGVDPELPLRAIERATQLLLELAGGSAGPVTLVRGANANKAAAENIISLRQQRVEQILGIKLKGLQIATYLQRLGMSVRMVGEVFQVTPPSWRFDLRIEEDLVEEIARLHGYDNIPESNERVTLRVGQFSEQRVLSERAATLLVDRGYQEAVTYSFVDPQQQTLLLPNETPITLANPISAELAAMRLSLWPGLLQALRENQRRQQARVRLFEVGRKFDAQGVEIDVIAGLVAGSALPEQWGEGSRVVDFFDLKADVETLLQLTGVADAFRFVTAEHSALHPGQCARIYRNERPVGWIGQLHPEARKRLDLTYPPFLFELEIEAALAARIPSYEEISKFPSIRRDLAVIVDDAVPLVTLRDAVRASAGELLRTLDVLSVYTGPPVEKGRKSIALGLNLHDTSRTLTDQDADAIVARVVHHLGTNLNATIRDK